MRSSREGWLKSVALIILLLALIVISMTMGKYKVSIFNIASWCDMEHRLVVLLFNIRLPRTLLVVISGATLSLSGYIYQRIFRNPLVSPDILGVSSGCSLGAVIAIVIFGGSVILRYSAAFVFGLLAVGLAMLITRAMKGQKLLGMIISGIVVSSMASSGIMFLKYIADPYTNLPAIEFWLMGGFYNSSWSNIVTLFPITLIGSIILFKLRWQLEIIGLGDEEAILLGCNPVVTRRAVIFITTIMISATVSIAGLVSWMSLIAPHLTRLYIKERTTAQMLGAMAMGSILLLIADIISRTAFTAEIPISILISFVGGPLLALLMYRQVVE